MVEETAAPARAALRLGFVGLRGVGRELAAALARAGFEQKVYDRELARAERFAQQHGGTAVAHLSQLAGSELLLFAPVENADDEDCNGNAEQSAEPSAGHSPRHSAERIAELAPQLSSGAIVVQMSAMAPAAIRALGARLARHGIALVEALPCAADDSKGPRLIAHASDDEAALEQVLPVLKAMGLPLVDAGALGNAQALRLLEAHVRSRTLAAAAESFLVADRIGLAPGSLRALLEASQDQSFDPELFLRSAPAGQDFAAGLALGILARNPGNGLAAGGHSSGLTRLLIEFMTPDTHSKETL